MLTDKDIPEDLRIPSELHGCWQRAYIKQSFREPRATDENGVTVYLQAANGLCIDCRIDRTGGEDHDCFLGIAFWNGNEHVLNWHVLVGYQAPQTATQHDSESATQSESLAQQDSSSKPEQSTNSMESFRMVIEKAISEPNCTEDRGRVTWVDEAKTVWLETDVERGSAVLEERWFRMPKGASDIQQNCMVEVVEASAERSTTTTFLTQGSNFAEVIIDKDGGTVFSMGVLTIKDGTQIRETHISTDSSLLGKACPVNV